MADWKAGNLAALCGSLNGLTAVFVGLRFYARKVTMVNCGPEDWLMVGAFIAFTGCCTCTIIGIQSKALGVSVHDLAHEDLLSSNLTAYHIQIAIYALSYLSLACTKASALFLYKRLFVVHDRGTFRIIIWSSIALVAVWFVAFEVLTGVYCDVHSSPNWRTSNIRYCAYSNPTTYGLVITDVLLDIWVSLLPLKGIIPLQMKAIKKIALAGIFLLALLGLGASVARMAVFIEDRRLSVILPGSIDARKSDSRLVFYWILEMGISIIAINMPIVWKSCASLSLSATESLKSYFTSSETSFTRHKVVLPKNELSESVVWCKEKDDLDSPDSFGPKKDLWYSTESFRSEPATGTSLV